MNEVIAKRETLDGVRVEFWSDGAITVGHSMNNRILARALSRDIVHVLMGEVCIYASAELKALVAAARKGDATKRLGACTMIDGTIRQEGGKLFVVYETTFDGRPVKREMWWAILSIKRNPYNAQEPSVGDRAFHQGNGVWSTNRPSANGSSSGSAITGDGSTEAFKVVDSPVPPPKVRKGIETRWMFGRWEKLLKSGWVSA